jgi:hypothetical protein
MFEKDDTVPDGRPSVFAYCRANASVEVAVAGKATVEEKKGADTTLRGVRPSISAGGKSMTHAPRLRKYSSSSDDGDIDYNQFDINSDTFRQAPRSAVGCYYRE